MQSVGETESILKKVSPQSSEELFSCPSKLPSKLPLQQRSNLQLQEAHTTYPILPLPSALSCQEAWVKMVNCYDTMAMNYCRTGQWERAKSCYQVILESLPEEVLTAMNADYKAKLLNNLAFTCEKLGEVENAFEYYLNSYRCAVTEIIQSKADSGMKFCLLRIGNALILANNKKEADKYYAALHLDMLDIKIYYQWLNAAYNNQRWEVALEQAHVITILFPDDIEIYPYLAKLYYFGATDAYTKGNETLYRQFIRKAKSVYWTVLSKTPASNFAKKFVIWPKISEFFLEENDYFDLDNKRLADESLTPDPFKNRFIDSSINLVTENTSLFKNNAEQKKPDETQSHNLNKEENGHPKTFS